MFLNCFRTNNKKILCRKKYGQIVILRRGVKKTARIRYIINRRNYNFVLK